VHPDDERYTQLVGKQVKLPLTDRLIPVIADAFVEKDFGSGVVKITPAHDFNDFEVGKKHNLPMISVLTKEAKVAGDMPEAYRGMDRFKARKQIVADLEALGLLEKVEPHKSQVGHAERDDTVLEPLVTDQWYVKTGPLAEECLKAARSGEVTFINKSDEANYYNWLENIQDWCISRQLWWGHRIPAWHSASGEIVVGAEAPKEGGPWTQDPDILDTWFSSALWPFSTLGWPEKTAKLDYFYPQAAIMPGRDILFFWIIRMMMMGKAFMKKAPFKQIYCHAMVLDEKGQKMSKSKGNVISPLDMIAKFGTDALRFSMTQQAALGQDIRMGENVVEQGRNFCTKLWNAAKYVEMQEGSAPQREKLDGIKHPVNQWIVSELKNVIAQIDGAVDGFKFNEYSQTIYQFTWNTFCDWYLELSKPLMQSGDEALVAETRMTLSQVFEAILRLLHPVAPFISEEIWLHHTDGKQGATISKAAWPQVGDYPTFAKAQQEISWLMNAVTAIRTARAENRVPPANKITAEVRGSVAKFDEFAAFFGLLARVEKFSETKREPAKTDAVVVVDGTQVLLPLEGIVDFAAEKARLQKELEKINTDLQRVQAQLGSESFVARAPAEVVAEKRVLEASLMKNLAELSDAINAM
jgi:valyl-tRNA synthetase